MNTETCTVCEIALRIIDRTGTPSWGGLVVVVMVLALIRTVVAVVVFVAVPVLVLTLAVVVAAAMVALAQLVDMVGTHARLGDLVDDVAAGVVIVCTVYVRWISRGPQDSATNRGMCAGVAAQPANGGIPDEAGDDQRDQRLRSQQHRHGLHEVPARQAKRQHLVGGRGIPPPACPASRRDRRASVAPWPKNRTAARCPAANRQPDPRRRRA